MSVGFDRPETNHPEQRRGPSLSAACSDHKGWRDDRRGAEAVLAQRRNENGQEIRNNRSTGRGVKRKLKNWEGPFYSASILKYTFPRTFEYSYLAKVIKSEFAYLSCYSLAVCPWGANMTTVEPWFSHHSTIYLTHNVARRATKSRVASTMLAWGNSQQIVVLILLSTYLLDYAPKDAHDRCTHMHAYTPVRTHKSLAKTFGKEPSTPIFGIGDLDGDNHC